MATSNCVHRKSQTAKHLTYILRYNRWKSFAYPIQEDTLPELVVRKLWNEANCFGSITIEYSLRWLAFLETLLSRPIINSLYRHAGAGLQRYTPVSSHFKISAENIILIDSSTLSVWIRPILSANTSFITWNFMARGRALDFFHHVIGAFLYIFLKKEPPLLCCNERAIMQRHEIQICSLQMQDQFRKNCQRSPTRRKHRMFLEEPCWKQYGNDSLLCCLQRKILHRPSSHMY